MNPPLDLANTMPLWQALIGFIITGSGDWTGEWNIAGWSLLFFLGFLVYNLARLALLWKTNQLETQEEITELPAQFSLQTHPFWHFVFTVTLGYFWVTIGLAVANSIHFFMMRVPLD